MDKGFSIYGTTKCTGCKTCEIACSYHHSKTFCPQIASIEIRRREHAGEFGIALYHYAQNKHLACDCPSGDEFCFKYCPVISREELKDILRGKIESKNEAGR